MGREEACHYDTADRLADSFTLLFKVNRAKFTRFQNASNCASKAGDERSDSNVTTALRLTEHLAFNHSVL